jgi:hypothetical protein
MAGRTRKPTLEPEPEPTDSPQLVDPGTGQKLSGNRVPRSLYMDEALLERLRAAATYLSAYKEDAGIRSLSDIVEPGAWAQVVELEKKYNKGKPFPPVTGKRQGGRPRSK